MGGQPPSAQPDRAGSPSQAHCAPRCGTESAAGCRGPGWGSNAHFPCRAPAGAERSASLPRPPGSATHSEFRCQLRSQSTGSSSTHRSRCKTGPRCHEQRSCTASSTSTCRRGTSCPHNLGTACSVHLPAHPRPQCRRCPPPRARPRCPRARPACNRSTRSSTARRTHRCTARKTNWKHPREHYLHIGPRRAGTRSANPWFPHDCRCRARDFVRSCGCLPPPGKAGLADRRRWHRTTCRRCCSNPPAPMRALRAAAAAPLPLPGLATWKAGRAAPQQSPAKRLRTDQRRQLLPGSMPRLRALHARLAQVQVLPRQVLASPLLRTVVGQEAPRAAEDFHPPPKTRLARPAERQPRPRLLHQNFLPPQKCPQGHRPSSPQFVPNPLLFEQLQAKNLPTQGRLEAHTASTAKAHACLRHEQPAVAPKSPANEKPAPACERPIRPSNAP